MIKLKQRDIFFLRIFFQKIKVFSEENKRKYCSWNSNLDFFIKKFINTKYYAIED